MVIDFEYERLKRSDYHHVCGELLEKLLYSFCSFDEDTKKEEHLKKFVKELDLGPTPLTHLVRTYFINTDAQFAADNIVTSTSFSILGNIIEFIEACWPQEKNLLKRFKVLLIGFSIKKLKLKGSVGSLLGNALDSPSMIEHIKNYLLGKDDTLEIEILSSPSNVLKFPSFKRPESVHI